MTSQPERTAQERSYVSRQIEAVTRFIRDCVGLDLGRRTTVWTHFAGISVGVLVALQAVERRLGPSITAYM